MYTNAGMDMAALAIEQANRKRSFDFDQSYAAAERLALIQADGSTLQTPEHVLAGSPAHVNQEFSYERGQREDERNIRRTREALNRGFLKPRQIVQHPVTGQIEYSFDNEHPVMAMADKKACIRCLNTQPDNMADAKRLHRRMKQSLPYRYEIPEGLGPMDCCCFCGAILGGRGAA